MVEDTIEDLELVGDAITEEDIKGIIPLMEVSVEVIGVKRGDPGLAESGVGVEDGKRGQECDVSIAREWVTTREIVGYKGKKRMTGETSFKHVVKKDSHVE